MKPAIFGLMIIAIFSGLGALGLMMSATERYAALGTVLCPVALISLLLFLYLAARQSRLDNQRR